MALVFVCSPYGGKRANYKKAREYFREEIDNGNTPIAPHVLYHGILSDDTDRFIGISLGLELLAVCDELHCWSEEITAGMKTEIEYAESAGIPVKYMERR